jgi:hypothetical protein
MQTAKARVEPENCTKHDKGIPYGSVQKGTTSR